MWVERSVPIPILLPDELIEEVECRRDDAEGAFALRITKRGLKAIQVDDLPDAEPFQTATEHRKLCQRKPRRTSAK
jgi:hypothetical protein